MNLFLPYSILRTGSCLHKEVNYDNNNIIRLLGGGGADSVGGKGGRPRKTKQDGEANAEGDIGRLK